MDIRSLARRGNHCTCPDFATNQLGTCKHIEAVRHRIAKRPDFDRIKDLPSPTAYVWLDWEGDEAPTIRLHRGAETATDLSPILQAHFDATGRFRQRVPDDFLRFVERVAGRADLEIGEDALAHARRLAEDAARAVRAAEIGERIRAGGGRLPDVRAKLYPYQVEGVAFLAGRGRALLADDMGLGKTLQAIAAAYWLHRHDGVERNLIVCPASLKRQWAREIEKFTGAQAQVIEGPTATRGVQYRKGPGFYVLNYELVLRDLELINAELCPDLLILDEAQRIKNWRTKVASAVKRIGSRYAFVLTGTPLENRLEDLYSLMQVIDPRVLGPLWRYMVDFHITDERGKVLGYRNLSELCRDRSLVRDQLPERIVQRVDVPMSDKQRAIHDDAVQAARQLAQIMRRRPLTPGEQNRMRTALQRARMACDAAALVDKEDTDAPKLDELCRMSGLKAVVFSQWERMTEQVEQRVRRLGQRRPGEATGGLLVVLDRVDDGDEAVVDDLSEGVPTALIDRRTLASLGRLGAASPIAAAEPVYEPAEIPGDDLAVAAEHPLSRKAREGLEAARLLIQQSCPGPALDLLLGALLAAAARRAGRDEPPTPQQAGIWLYGEALPEGRLGPDDAALLMRALALAQGAAAIPEPLLTALADAAAAFIEAQADPSRRV
ncbi:DNA/RNA helicase, superfamily II, SNF2 family [Thioflavicoccus mobilis 8321]|uniref:DNA/RNA helicase, superfamily II, SNF2 family n=1 Tax=Thioflavicoccus mobilis 8321 TaxID=765912 RepID=L0GYP8_9GAMM|nr:SNF2-related protein [Thioflavicoccus mobilis]AGA91903.1 DNA/RNA helicase, superfamily II, SNF2 family [Thioflavicoccus mobilis 8321]